MSSYTRRSSILQQMHTRQRKQLPPVKVPNQRQISVIDCPQSRTGHVYCSEDIETGWTNFKVLKRDVTPAPKTYSMLNKLKSHVKNKHDKIERLKDFEFQRIPRDDHETKNFHVSSIADLVLATSHVKEKKILKEDKLDVSSSHNHRLSTSSAESPRATSSQSSRQKQHSENLNKKSMYSNISHLGGKTRLDFTNSTLTYHTSVKQIKKKGTQNIPKSKPFLSRGSTVTNFSPGRGGVGFLKETEESPDYRGGVNTNFFVNVQPVKLPDRGDLTEQAYELKCIAADLTDSTDTLIERTTSSTVPTDLQGVYDNISDTPSVLYQFPYPDYIPRSLDIYEQRLNKTLKETIFTGFLSIGVDDECIRKPKRHTLKYRKAFVVDTQKSFVQTMSYSGVDSNILPYKLDRFSNFYIHKYGSSLVHPDPRHTTLH